MPLYKGQFAAGSLVRIAALNKLQEQRASWKYHHPITEEHLKQAGAEAHVIGISFYHGGDPLYVLEDIPRLLWHEFSLESAE